MWVLYALLGAITAALTTITAKIGLKGIDATFATGIRSFFMFVFMALAVFATGKFSNFDKLDRNALIAIIASAVFGAASWLFSFLALKNGGINGASAIDRMSIVFVIILSTLFLSEKLTVKVALGGLLIALGAILVAV